MNKHWAHLLAGRPTLGGLLTTGLRLVAVLALGALIFSEAVLFRPQPASYPPDQIEHLVAADGERIAWRIWRHPSPRATVIFSHGNAEDLGEAGPFIAVWRRLDCTVVGYDYPGYGHSTGRPSEAGAQAAIRAVHDRLRAEGGDPQRILLHGRSVGGGPSTWLATQVPVGGLLLESTFTSAFRVALPVNPLPCDRFDNLARIGGLTCPVALIHGSADATIPFKHGRALLAAAPPGTTHLWVDGAGHDDLMLVSGIAYDEFLRGFLDRVTGNGLTVAGIP